MKRIVVFGLGAIGSNLLLNLAKIYSNMFYTGVDFDLVEERNLNTQPYFINHERMPKVSAMQILLFLKKRQLRYIPVEKKITSTKDVQIYINDETLLLDCFDNTESRQMLEGINNCLHIGFSPAYTAEIIWGTDYTAPPNLSPDVNDICQLNEAVPFINFVVAMATFTIQDFLDNGIRSNWLITNKYKLRKLS